MRTYLEALEQIAFGADAEFVRIDVTGKSQAERNDILIKLKDFMNDNGSVNVFTKHSCNHDTGGISCVSEVV